MNEGVNKLAKWKNICMTKKYFFRKSVFLMRKIKCYPMESFVDCFRFHNNPICKKKQNNENKKSLNKKYRQLN